MAGIVMSLPFPTAPLEKVRLTVGKRDGYLGANNRSVDHRGDPDFSFGGFSLWVHGWERDSADFWDNNWLDITARFKSGSAMGSTVVVVAGTILHSTDLEYAAETFAKLNDSLQGIAEFATLDPGFHLKLEARLTGAIGFTVEMVPGPDESYEYSTELDQTYLAPAVAALGKVVKAFGPRGERPPITPRP